MANLNAAHGLRPLRYLSGVAYTGAVTRYRKEAAVILGVGDPVVHAGSSSTAGTNGALETGIPTITRAAAAAGTITGVALWMEKDAGTAGRAHDTLHLASADRGYVYVADDPHLIFEGMEDSVGGSIPVTAVGEGVDLIVTDANTSTGLSNVMLDSSTSPGGTDQLRVFALLNTPSNELGTNARWEVMINLHTYNAAQTMI